MKNVLYKNWIPKEMQKAEGAIYETIKPGTGCWEKEFTHEGLFHQWANAFEESSEGFGNYTVALIQKEDGTIVEVLPSNVKFLDV